MTSHITQADPSRWVVRFAGLVPAGGWTLDLACGGGRHARHLASLGHQVLAVDRDPAALAVAAGERIHTQVVDLEAPGSNILPDWPLVPGRFSGIVVTNYLHRPLLPALFASLAKGGVLIYETFAEGNGLFGKPSNPDFLLSAGELLGTTSRDPELHVLAFEDGYVHHPQPAMVQRICLLRQTAQISARARALDAA
ncbi:MAG: class I SAM-dependent methyltransferase [Oxalobacteraceae bacterium]